MSGGSAELRRDFGGEQRVFRVTVGPLRKIQENTGAGPLQLAARLRMAGVVLKAMSARDYSTLARLDVRQVAEKVEQREIILQALLGGGMNGPLALKLVKDWVEERPQIETLALAEDLCLAAVIGNEDEPLGEPVGPTTSPISPTVVSASAPSTAPAKPPASRRAKSTSSPCGSSATP